MCSAKAIEERIYICLVWGWCRGLVKDDDYATCKELVMTHMYAPHHHHHHVNLQHASFSRTRYMQKDDTKILVAIQIFEFEFLVANPASWRAHESGSPKIFRREQRAEHEGQTHAFEVL